jgi:selenocysteine-specific elongation factor
MRIFATAGHVDHGKSSLVAALTGTNPDRLKEEQIREMTIDLGFAFFSMPSGQEFGLVDVPGHIDFIDNMLAGMGGLAGVLLVIAADEGLMPQTLEHLEILNLLEIQPGIVVLTKIDLVEDASWLDLVEAEVRNKLAITSLKDSPIVRVSTKTGVGLDDLKQLMNEVSSQSTTNRNVGSPRLPVDRVFTIQGFGTIVTGTLLDGTFRIGDEVEILPRKIKTRIRGLQMHNMQMKEALPGSRTAVNLANVKKEEIRRGDVLAKPGTYHPTSRLDAGIRLISEKGMILKHHDKVKFHSGTSHTFARVRVLGSASLGSAESGLVQLDLGDPICVKSGDHFIIRQASPSRTIGGGVILDPHPAGRYKLNDLQKIEQLIAKQKGSLREKIISEMFSFVSEMELAGKIDADWQHFHSELQSLVSETTVTELIQRGGVEEKNFFILTHALQELKSKVETELALLQSLFPLRKNFAKDELLKKTRIRRSDLEILLENMVDQGVILRDGQGYLLPGKSIVLSPAQQKKKIELWRKIDENPYTPPTYEECSTILGKELLLAMTDFGELVRVSEEIVFRKDEFDDMLEYVKNELKAGNSVTIANLRDKFTTSRKYVLPFLEHLDRTKITRRLGEGRVSY